MPKRLRGKLLKLDTAMMKSRKHVLRTLTGALAIVVLVGYFCWGKGESLATPTPAETIAPQGTIVVTSTSDSGLGTLRRALLEAYSGDIIIFDPTVFPPNAPATIAVMSELPHIHQSNLTLDASQAGVILDGSHVPGEWVGGLQIVSSEANTIWGLQVSHFPGPGIAISGDAKHNVIGGDRSLGAGPFGRGNLFSNNEIGIDLSTSGTTLNTVTGNLIGTDTEGTDTLGNYRDGVSITEGAHNNTIGPDNIIANNGRAGVYYEHSDSGQNTIIQNSIYDNGVGKGKLAAPIILDYDLSAGTATGATCANCTVEIFSTSRNVGEIFEGQTIANELGVFSFNKGASFTGPYLTATTTDVNGRTSEFSWPTSGTDRSLFLQQGNDLPRTRFVHRLSRELDDNHIATQFDSFGFPTEFYDCGIYRSGVTRARVAIAGLEPELVDWNKPEFSIAPIHDDVFTRMAENGLTITYVLTFWDKATYPDGEGAPCARFKTEGEIERYLEFVRFIVEHFKDRVQYYEIWNEPDIREYCPKWIESADYINLVKRTVPVIREVYPEAKIVVGGVSNTRFSDAYDYLFDLLESDIMPLVDVISWHPMYGTSPEYDLYKDYYYGYPAMVQRIKETAAANGFVGEYRADELSWRTPDTAIPDQPWVYSPIVADKYFGRAALMHLGTDIDVGLGMHAFLTPNLCTAMAGAEPVNLPIEIKSTATNIVSYTFSLPDGDYLVGLWTDGVAVDEDPGVKANLTLQGFTGRDVMGIDVLNGFQQPIVTSNGNGNLTIRNLIVRDYPLILKLEHAEATIETCDSTGLYRNVFNLTETVYVNGTGYSPSATYEICVVNDVASWNDGMEIPARIPGTATTVSSDSSGHIPPTAVWGAGLSLGKYDIVVDVDGNGVYDDEIAALDNDDIEVTAGFLTIPEFPSFLILPLCMVATLLAVILCRTELKR